MKQLTETQVNAYIKKNELNKIINFSENSDYHKKATDTISGTLKIPFPPEKHDLVRLHKLIRDRKVFTAMEFGVGYSTPIIADALYKNKLDWENLKKKPIVRNNHQFHLFSVDASQKWINETKKRLPKHLKSFVTFQFSEITIGKYQDQICHYYNQLPNVVPDFIYVDAPDTRQVKGSINGLNFYECEERTVMSADLLLMEPTLLPGTFILVDGRTNNARFLARNFRREFKVDWDKLEDITTMELVEEPLGKYNLPNKKLFKSSRSSQSQK